MTQVLINNIAFSMWHLPIGVLIFIIDTRLLKRVYLLCYFLISDASTQRAHRVRRQKF